MASTLDVIDLTDIRRQLDQMVEQRLDFAFTELDDRRYERLSTRELELIATY